MIYHIRYIYVIILIEKHIINTIADNNYMDIMLNLKYHILKTPPKITNVDGLLPVIDGLDKLKHTDKEVYYDNFGHICVELTDKKLGISETYISKTAYKTLVTDIRTNTGENNNVLTLKKQSIYNNRDDLYKYYKVYQ